MEERGVGGGAHFQLHLKQTDAPFVSIGAAYLGNMVGPDSRAVIAGCWALGLSAWRAPPASETPSPICPFNVF